MTIYFISDLHLNENEPQITECLLSFLQQQAPSAEALYILGDFFEAWIGDEQTPLIKQLTVALRKLTAQGVIVYFMQGNRDFLITNKFTARCGMILLTDPTVTYLYARKVLLMHGDLLCTNDKAYQRFRKWAHKPFIKACFLFLPLFIRRYIANKARAKSRVHSNKTVLSVQDVNQQTVTQYLTSYQTILLIHGHTHRPAIHEFMLKDKPARRIVLAAWHKQGSVLSYQPNGKLEIITLPFKPR